MNRNVNNSFLAYNCGVNNNGRGNEKCSSLPDDLLLAGGVGDNRFGIGGGGGGGGGGATGKFIKEP